MTKKTKPIWIPLLIGALISIALWWRFSYPQLTFVNLTVDRAQAQTIAEQYLEHKDVDLSAYTQAMVFRMDKKANQFLQRTLGFQGMNDFITTYNYDLFFWHIRYFKPQDKEEYSLAISSSSGDIISYRHVIDENAERPDLERDTAEPMAQDFITRQFNLDIQQYELNGDLSLVRDHRTDFHFTWRRKDVDLTWSNEEQTGEAKLTSGVKITGGEILSFWNNALMIPDHFRRDIELHQNTSDNIMTIVKIFYYILFTAAVYFVIVRRNHLAMHTSKHFYLWIAFFSFVLSILASINQFQQILFEYKTAGPFNDYVWRYFMDVTRNAVFINLGLLLPGLAGELMHYEVARDNTKGSLLHNIRSTFFSRDIAAQICTGYGAFFCLLGIQAVLIEFGQRYLNVWIEHSWMTMLSTAYLPFLAAFILGCKASLFEEVLYRLFAINWGKKLFKSSAVAVVLSALIWGFAHSNYPVFPMWFRGIEVSCLGILLGVVYLRYGFVSVLVAHFLFDVFWSSASHLFGQSVPIYFYSAIFVLALPLIYAGIAFILNRSNEEKALVWKLNTHQHFNLDILKTYLQTNPDWLKNRSREEITNDFAGHGWDIAIVETAIEDQSSEKTSDSSENDSN